MDTFVLSEATRPDTTQEVPRMIKFFQDLMDRYFDSVTELTEYQERLKRQTAAR
ncbi:hypothetical protein GCM10009785_21520 [Brooklawnia cerclae]